MCHIDEAYIEETLDTFRNHAKKIGLFRTKTEGIWGTTYLRDPADRRKTIARIFMTVCSNHRSTPITITPTFTDHWCRLNFQLEDFLKLTENDINNLQSRMENVRNKVLDVNEKISTLQTEKHNALQSLNVYPFDA